MSSAYQSVTVSDVVLGSGDNNVGNVDIVTIPVETPTTDGVAAFLGAGRYVTRTSGGVQALVTPVWTAIDFGSSGDNTVISAPGANLQTIVLGGWFVSASDVAVTMKTGSTAKTGAMPIGTTAGRTPGISTQHTIAAYVCATNEAYVINLGGAVACDGWVCSITVPTN